MSCRTGPLRVERPLRGVYTGLAGMIFLGPPVGREIIDPDQREGLCCLFHPDKLKRRANARPTRSGPVRQDISLYTLSENRGHVYFPHEKDDGCGAVCSCGGFAAGDAG
jgi:hypothetical protein